MTESIRVSVIMPFLNLESYLEEAIESVVAQTCPCWELLLVDDGSTDGSSDIARAWAARIPERIRYLEFEGHVNRGASAARNLGLREARGEFIALLDGDDAWVPEKLEQQVKLLDDIPEAGAVYGRTLLWYSWAGSAPGRHRDTQYKLGVRPATLLPGTRLLTLSLQQRAPLPATCSIIMRREAVEHTGGFEESFRRVYTDQAFYAKLLLDTSIYVADACWDRYRQHRSSSIAVATHEGVVHAELPHQARYEYLRWLEQYLLTREVVDRGVWRALQRQLWLYRHPRLHIALSRARLLPDRVRRFYWQRAVPFAFALGRLILPRRVRQRLWQGWLKDRM
jgi:glycosyltransferase involved in cell wall biosynthesis